MRKAIELPAWLQGITLVGNEPKDEKDKDSKDSKDDSDDDEDDEDEEDDDKGDKDDKSVKPENEALLAALRKERKRANIAEKALKKANASVDETTNKDLTEKEKAQKQASEAEKKSAKLAEKLLDGAVDNAIIKMATGLNFRDIDDALKLVDRGDIGVEQDEDDPSEIELDEKSVETALKSLAKSKPHLIMADGQGDRSGSRFGGGKSSKRTDKDAEDQVLRGKYAALNRSAHTN